MKLLMQQFHTWYKTPSGHLVSEAESSALTKFLPKLTGACILQMGGCSELSLVDKRLVKQFIQVAPSWSTELSTTDVYVQAELDQLPFLPHSLDVVLMPHLLEFAPNPKIILQALPPFIKPEGHLIIFSFNPFSLWGIYKYFKKDFPWNGKFYTASKIRKWLAAVDLEVINYETLYFRPPMQTAESLRKMLFLEAIGRIFWTNWGAVNVLVAKKRVTTLTPIIQPLYTKQVVNEAAILKPSVRISR